MKIGDVVTVRVTGRRARIVDERGSGFYAIEYLDNVTFRDWERRVHDRRTLMRHTRRSRPVRRDEIRARASAASTAGRNVTLSRYLPDPVSDPMDRERASLDEAGIYRASDLEAAE